MSWAAKKLDEIADFHLGKMLDEKKNKGDPLPYLANVNVRWGEFELSDLRLMRFETSELERFSLKYGDIVMCEGGEPGRCAIWKEQLPKMMYQKALHRIRSREGVDNRFLYYAFLHKGKRGGFSPLFTGSTIKHLPKQQLAKVEVEIPDLQEQLRIADLLSKYDDLIENNKRRIELLEESARQLYKEWFVRFRFPGHEHVKIIDGVPEGWEKSTYGEVAETVGGGTPSTKVPEYWEDGDVTWFVPKDLTQNNSLVLLDSGKKITKLGLQKSSAKILPPNTIMMSSRATIGYFGLYDGEASTNQGFISVIPHKENTQMYLLHNLMSRKEEIIGLAGGTTYKEINKTTFRGIEVLIPSETLLNEFQDYVSDLINQVRTLMKQNHNLIRARDLLLPKLMNGEIAV